MSGAHWTETPRRRASRRPRAPGAILCAATLALILAPAQPEAATAHRAELIAAIQGLARQIDGPPSVIVTVERNGRREVFRTGLAALACEGADCSAVRPPRTTDSLRIASLAKTFSGAAALSLVTDGLLSLDDRIGMVLPDLPKQWHQVSLRELLNHTSGLPDFGASEAFARRVNRRPTDPPSPRGLLDFVKDEPLQFAPGSQYRYSNSDNIVVGLMAEAASGKPYRQVLRQRIGKPLKQKHTLLPTSVALPVPFIHGYGFEAGRPLDVSELVDFGGYAWASGGLVSTPAELRRFVRAYVSGELFGAGARKQQFKFRPGNSSPQGPGENAVGLALFRYKTRCGTMFGHTGSILGYTHLIAASRDGSKAMTFAISTQAEDELVPHLRKAQEAAVCLALEG